MKYLNNINMLWFVIAFILGLIIAQLTFKPIKTVIRYDNKNRGKLVYEDKDENNEVCYKYVAEEIRCPNSDEVLDHPTTYGSSH